MIFAIRGILISSSIFVVLYCALSVTVCNLWRRVWYCGERHQQRRCADLLFALRMLPFGVASAVTFVVAVPSFLLLEPRAGSESIGPMPSILGLCGIVLLIWGIRNATMAWMRASRMLAQWSLKATFICSSPIRSQKSVSVLRTSADVPPLTAAGIFRPTVWLSRAAEFVLNDRELQTALRHEAVHVQRRDNLRKLVMRLVAFPGMNGLERAWRERTEMAADDAAVSSASEALDLAAAVIKLSRLVSVQPAGEVTMALVHSPAESVNARVERLISWNERHDVPNRHSFRYSLCAAAVAVTTLAVTYSYLLVRMHAVTEWLVR
ncbi:MAG: peptidase BlaR1 [Candidatus Sulfotelmatobacter sp.]|nr:peptidase BlaR1 [Candidatus Sulfotelmatobacter sp.]